MSIKEDLARVAVLNYQIKNDEPTRDAAIAALQAISINESYGSVAFVLRLLLCEEEQQVNAAKALGYNDLPDGHPATHGDHVSWLLKELRKARAELATIKEVSHETQA